MWGINWMVLRCKSQDMDYDKNEVSRPGWRCDVTKVGNAHIGTWIEVACKYWDLDGSQVGTEWGWNASLVCGEGNAWPGWRGKPNIGTWMSDSCIRTWLETWLIWMVLRCKSQDMDWGILEFTGPGRKWNVTWRGLRRSYMYLDGNVMQILGPRWRLNGTPIPGPCSRWDLTWMGLSN